MEWLIKLNVEGGKEIGDKRDLDSSYNLLLF